jgi:RNA polymerase sigma factor (TIGR02999 family)
MKAAAVAAAAWPATYAALKRIASARLAASGRQGSLNTTALVHESYLKLAATEVDHFPSEGHFYAYASQVMRSVIIDLIRENKALQRGGGQFDLTLNTGLLVQTVPDEALQVDEALRALASVEPRLAQVVEMRYFAGLSEAEIALALGLTDRTVRRDWEKARLLLHAMLVET